MTHDTGGKGLPHIPVLLSETINFLDVKPGGFYIDATLGAGGHTKAILQKEPSAKVLGIDCDPIAIETAKKNLSGKEGLNFTAVPGNFADIESISANSGKADGVVADLGISSMQIADDRRGFSFNSDGNLDMRMGGEASGGISASDVVNTFPEEELERIFRLYGEERFAGRIARAIVKNRTRQTFTTARSLGDLVARCVGFRRGRRIHPATRVFQALRIFVNNETENLARFLDALPRVLKKGGRCVVISFHSGEDRIVKKTFASYALSGTGRLLTRKPVVPCREEIERNPRSRSAKLRAIEFVCGGDSAGG